MDLQLKNKVAVITGGSVGIGLAVAHALAEEGDHMVIIWEKAYLAPILHPINEYIYIWT